MRLNIQLFAEGEIIIQATIGTKNFDRQIKYMEERMLEIEYLLEQADKGYEVGDTLKLEAEYEKLGNQLSNLIAKRNELENPTTPTIQDNLKGIETSLGGIIKKVGKWALAVFSVRSAYSLVRGAISTLSQTDDGLATKVEYIRWAIANTLKPVIEWVINAVYKLLSIFGGIIKAITGVNIFSNSSAKNFESMKKSTGAIKNSTSAIKKNLYGWDEMTRVEESGGGVLGGLASGIKDIMNDLPDLASMVDDVAKKIKEGFRLPTREELEEMGKPFRQAWGGIYDWLDKNFVKPNKKLLKDFIEDTKPIWQPLVDKFKEAFSPLYNWVKDTFIDPVTTKLKTFRDNFISKYATFINKIIYGINLVGSIWGVNIGYIDEETLTTSDDVNELGTSLKNTTKPKWAVNMENISVKNTNTTLKDTLNYLKDLVSRRWGINASVSISGSSLKSWYNDTLRSKLSGYGIKLPKLAMGGIVNMPSKGVPIGSAIAGESGVEGVIPLTDSQQMQLLGEAIGRYITINANITNTMNGRIIGRELQKINNENSFASNR